MTATCIYGDFSTITKTEMKLSLASFERSSMDNLVRHRHRRTRTGSHRNRTTAATDNHYKYKAKAEH